MSPALKLIKGHFRSSRFDGIVAHVPYARVRVINDGAESVEVDALIDTGASINLVSMALAVSLLKKSPEDIRSGKRIRINCVGGQSDAAYQCFTDLRIRPSSTSVDYLDLPNVELYVSERQLPAPFLFGQVAGLESLLLIHINRGPQRYWNLKL